MDKKYIDAEHFKCRVMKSAYELNDAAMYDVAKAICEMVDCESGDDVSNAEQKWIPVTERLPDIAGMQVLVVAVNSFGQKEVVQAFTSYDCPVEFETNNKVYDMIWKTAWKVTHWMPIPDAPGGKYADET